MNPAENSIQHLAVFLRKLRDRTPFGLIRPGDGEYLIMLGQTIHTQDKWDFEAGGSIQQDLLRVKDAISGHPNLFVGIPCKGCHGESVTAWYKEKWGLTEEQTTYATICCNKNWKEFTSYFTKSRHPFYYIGPGTHFSAEMNILGNFEVDSQLVNKWDTERVRFLMRLTQWVASTIEKENGATFLLSAGPVSKIVIPMLHDLYPFCQFLDVGSSLDPFTKDGPPNRFYLTEHDRCSSIICDFQEGHTVADGRITAVLNAFRRPHVLREQIAAIKGQTHPPTEIIIWKDGSKDSEPKEEQKEEIAALWEEIRADPMIMVIECNKNRGVWPRFAGALLANTEYVCVCDDDTIPGPKWFYNCLDTMRRVNGLLGTVGIIFNKNPTCYNSFGPRIGWDGPSFDIREVDMVCHCWFLRRAWIPELFKIVPDYNMMFRAGEDMGISFALQKIGIKTYVPAHPHGDFDMFGSLPDKARKYGTESVAISVSGASDQFDPMFNFYKKRGFQFLLDRL